MARYITGIFILLLANIMPLQAQRKEPEVKACERTDLTESHQYTVIDQSLRINPESAEEKCDPAH